jgi:hypothetical protein
MSATKGSVPSLISLYEFNSTSASLFTSQDPVSSWHSLVQFFQSLVVALFECESISDIVDSEGAVGLEDWTCLS